MGPEWTDAQRSPAPSAGPEGPGARPGGRLEKGKEVGLFQAAFLTAHFATYLEEGGGGVSRPPGKVALDKHVKRADMFVAFLVNRGIPVVAVNELDLREFLYWRYPFRQDPDDAAEAMLGSLRRFFAFLEELKGVRCPWAKATLTDIGASMCDAPFVRMTRTATAVSGYGN